MNREEIIAAWNAQADEFNQWGELGEDEKLAWAMTLEREACAEVCDAVEIDKWRLYNGYEPYGEFTPGRNDPRTEALSDGAALCSEAIRARSNA